MNRILDRLMSGVPARLIPNVADSKREERATSVLLSIMSVVPDFAKALLGQVGVSISRRSEITCYTEVVFRDVSKKLRPDGLVIVRNGSKTWSALVEAKIGGANLKQEQLDDYVILCREVGADALITISNQFALRPDHHPLLIPRKHLRYIDVAHFSWLSIISQSLLSISEKWVADVEQTFMLRELIRFLEHESSGVGKNVKMAGSWSEVVAQVQMSQTLRRNVEVEEVVGSWHQLLRFVSIQLTIETGRLVNLVLTRQRRRDPDFNFSEDVDQLVKKNVLTAEFEVPGSSSRIFLRADLVRRTFELSSRLLAPTDRSRPQSCINWFVRQLREAQELDPLVRVYWPRSSNPSNCKLSEIELGGINILISEARKKTLPTSFEVAWVIDLGGRFKGRSTFVDDVTGAVPRFYEVVSERLREWKPKVTKEPRDYEETSLISDQQKPVSTIPDPIERAAFQRQVDPPREVFRIAQRTERRYLDDRYN